MYINIKTMHYPVRLISLFECGLKIVESVNILVPVVDAVIIFNNIKDGLSITMVTCIVTVAKAYVKC